jgi:hypothetical protein
METTMEDKNTTKWFWLYLYSEMWGFTGNVFLSQAVANVIDEYRWLQHDILREAEEDPLRRTILKRADNGGYPLEAHTTTRFWLALDAAILAEDAPQAIGSLYEHYRPLAEHILKDAERDPLRKMILDRADKANVKGPLSSYLPEREEFPF